MGRRRGVRCLPELVFVARRSQVRRQCGRQPGDDEQANRGDTQGLHAVLRRKPRCAVSVRVVAKTVRKVTTTVRLTRSVRSRDWAACQASCPIPGTSQTTSMGRSTPMAMLIETPSNATNCGAVTGATCQ